MSARHIAVVTGSRAEYGILRCVLEDLRDTSGVELQLVVTAMHLSPEFGHTVDEIEADGFVVDERVELLLSSDTEVGVSKSVGLGVIGFADAFQRLRPALILLLGDRFETLAAAQAAMMARIPIAHVHGGEVSEGAIDDSIRHAITKFASLHFVAAESFRRRVIQLGECPTRVLTVGAPGLDSLRRRSPPGRAKLAAELGMKLDAPLLLVTYHPATRGEPPVDTMCQLLAALDRFEAHEIIITYPNADAGGRALIALIDEYVAARAPRVASFASLGQDRYHGLLRLAEAVVGNSSSGLIEAPSFRVPTVNVGRRQKGRLRADSVIDCGEETESIAAALRQALAKSFRDSLRDVSNPYGDGRASERIVKTVTQIDLSDLCTKPFYDVEWT